MHVYVCGCVLYEYIRACEYNEASVSEEKSSILFLQPVCDNRRS